MIEQSKLYPKSYGAWAGEPKGHAPDYERCCEQVHSRERFARFSQCQKPRGHGPDGAVRARFIELTGSTAEGFEICDIWPGTDPNVTEAELIETMAQSMARIEQKRRDGTLVDQPPRTGKPARKLSDVVADAFEQ